MGKIQELCSPKSLLGQGKQAWRELLKVVYVSEIDVITLTYEFICLKLLCRSSTSFLSPHKPCILLGQHQATVPWCFLHLSITIFVVPWGKI